MRAAGPRARIEIVEEISSKKSDSARSSRRRLHGEKELHAAGPFSAISFLRLVSSPYHLDTFMDGHDADLHAPGRAGPDCFIGTIFGKHAASTSHR